MLAVTSNDAEGESYLDQHGPAPRHLRAGTYIWDGIWLDDAAHPDPEASSDPARQERIRLEPTTNGFAMRVATLQPQGREPTISVDEIRVARSCVDTAQSMDRGEPGMHPMRTINYGVVLSGETDLELRRGSAPDAGRRGGAAGHAPCVAERWN